jgi:hypothetical protein
MHARVIGVAGGGLASRPPLPRRAVGGSVSASPRRDMLIVRGGRRQVRGHGHAAGTDAAEVVPRHAQGAAADVPEIARERRHGENRADRRPCTPVPLQPQTDANRRGARVREPPSQRSNVLGR